MLKVKQEVKQTKLHYVDKKWGKNEKKNSRMLNKRMSSKKVQLMQDLNN